MSKLRPDLPRQSTDVVVSGLGIVTALGNDALTTWDALLDGRTACSLLSDSQIDHREGLSRLLSSNVMGAAVHHGTVARTACQRAADAGFDLTPSFLHDPLNAMVLASVLEAVSDSELPPNDFESAKVGCVIGTSKPSLRALEWQYQQSHKSAESDLWTSGFLPESPLNIVRRVLKTKGPTSCPVAACATGLISVLQATDLIRSGVCDRCVVGSGDASLRASVLAGFHRLGVTSRSRNVDRCCRPFDRSRDGFFVGEGAAAFVLETRELAENRGRQHYAVIQDGGWMTDPTGMTQIDESGRVVADLVERLATQNRPAAINVHGTATVSNDLAEGRGLQAVFGSALNQIPVFGTKGATGHLLGGAGSVEFAVALLANREKRVPCSFGFDEYDPEVGVNLTKSAQSISAGPVLKLSLGFGGHVAACVIESD